MKTALLSVFHKDGIVEFAEQLVALGFTIYASGGTHKHLVANHVESHDVAELVGGEAILGHRVVTLSREVHAGLLAKNTPEDLAELAELVIPYIDIVCVDLYPLEAEIAREGSTYESVIEKTDIGGPTMIRSGSKGGRVVVCDPADRQSVIDWLKSGASEDAFVKQLSAKGEYTIAKYCMASAQYLSGGKYAGFFGEKVSDCAYGENGWQTPAVLYVNGSDDPLALSNFQLVEGSPPSYNNQCDIDRLLQTVTHVAAGFDVNFGHVPNIVVGSKHGNPCGAGVGGFDAWEKALRGDELALFGGLIMTNFVITKEHLAVAEKVKLDGLIAPGFADETIEHFTRAKGKCRLLVNPALAHLNRNSLDTGLRIRYVRGGFLTQPNYTFIPKVVDDVQQYGDATTQQQRDLLFAWAIGATSNSNTITIVKDGMLLANAVGQQDRVGAARLAIARAQRSKHDTEGSVAYSDSFFPFRDAPEVLVDVGGINAIFTSSGSVNDQQVIDLCAERETVLWMIPDKIGRGFFGH